MRRSKLEMYIDILKVLGQKGPSKIENVMHEANINCNVLKGNLSFLIKQGLIEERVVGKGEVVYANTVRGTTVVDFFKETNRTLPINDEDNNVLPPPHQQKYSISA